MYCHSLLFRHPLYSRESPLVIGGDYITTETGRHAIWFVTDSMIWDFYLKSSIKSTG
jgi:hypothetical protein